MPDADSSSQSPLRTPGFRAFWLASFASNVGSWMHSVAAAWLMTSLTPSPLMAALVQSAGTLPLFLFCLPAGAYADLLDRRRLLLVTQASMLTAAFALAALTLAGLAGPWTLLAMTFAMGCAAAWNAPAWSASIPDLVTREQMPAAMTLNSVQFNAARAVGPAIGGVLLIAASPGLVFLLNSLSFLAVIAVLRDWKGMPRTSEGQDILPFIAEGVRFVRNDRGMRTVMRRTSTFTLFASSLWALMPAVARQLLHTSSAGFGSMLGALGVGAVLAGILLARGREAYRDGLLIAAGTLGFTCAILGLTQCASLSFAAYALLLIGGIAWMVTMSTLNIAAQKALPDWVRARGLSVHILIFNGGMAFGGWIWGQAAEHYGLTAALLASGVGLLVLLPFSLRGYSLSK